jgi:hypothetical protein
MPHGKYYCDTASYFFANYGILFFVRYISVETLNPNLYTITKAELVGGSRPRLSLIDKKTHQKYILKSYTHNSREVFAECLASFLGNIIKIPIQKVSMKRLPDALVNALKQTYPALPSAWLPIGSLVRNVFSKGGVINYGANIIGTPTESMSLEYIEKFFRRSYYMPDDLLESFSAMIIFDAIIGNMDRHHENWGIVESDKFKQYLLFNKKQIIKERKFTPLFDHGSSLLFELNEKNVIDYLHNFNHFEKQYIFKSKYSFIKDSNNNEANIFAILDTHIKSKTAWGNRFRKVLKTIIPHISIFEIAKKIAQMPNIPDIQYSNNRRELLLKSIIRRLERLEYML